MATTTTTQPPINRNNTKVCFSFAAYSKDLIAHLHHHSNVPVAHGLTEPELSAIESTFNFSFPPDLRSILREGLPVGQGFPNWRSSSPQQLDILIHLPILGLCKQVSRQKFWYPGWGERPKEDDEAVELAKGFLKRCPVLVPVYQNCYVPTSPCLSGNPVFYVSGSEVKLCSYDVIGLFHQIELKEGVVSGMRLGHFLRAPVWAATEARRIEFWTELVELKEQCFEEMQGKEAYIRSKLAKQTLDPTGKRWWGGSELGQCLEDVRLKLRKGGWKEEDLDEMMIVTPQFNTLSNSKVLNRGVTVIINGDENSSPSPSLSPSPRSSMTSWSSSSDDDGGGVAKRVVATGGGREDVVRILSQRLLRGGWSMGDVVESLGCLTDHKEDRTVEIENGGGGDSLFDFEHMTNSCVDDSQSDV
ncbi:hypothetical protein HanPI659440_Chr07g0264771 [Helianthus annuus]|nr:hypothetical protein HanPI659440_Chr07g0264771 [Helianthus annuus]